MHAFKVGQLVALQVVIMTAAAGDEQRMERLGSRLFRGFRRLRKAQADGEEQ